MRYNPEALDYEGVFPPRRSYPREGEPVEQRTLFNQPEVEIASSLKEPGAMKQRPDRVLFHWKLGSGSQEKGIA